MVVPSAGSAAKGLVQRTSSRFCDHLPPSTHRSGSTPRGPGETDGRESTGPRRHGGHRGLPAPRRATSDARTATKVVVLFDPGIPSGNGAFIEGESFSSDDHEPRKCNLDPAGWDSGSWSPSEKS